MGEMWSWMEAWKGYNTKVTEEMIGDLEWVEYTDGGEWGTANRIADSGFAKNLSD
jgi:hypothetical protein